MSCVSTRTYGQTTTACPQALLPSLRMVVVSAARLQHNRRRIKVTVRRMRCLRVHRLCRLQHMCGPTGTGAWRWQGRLARRLAERNSPAPPTPCYPALETSRASHRLLGRLRRLARREVRRPHQIRGLTCGRRQLTLGIAARRDVLRAIEMITLITRPASAFFLGAKGVISHGRRAIRTQSWGIMCRT